MRNTSRSISHYRTQTRNGGVDSKACRIYSASYPDALKKLCFDLKNKLNDFVAVVCANIGGKPFVAIGIAESVVAARQLDAAKMIKEIVAPRIKGGGGGQKNLATAGGQNASDLNGVIAAVREYISK